MSERMATIVGSVFGIGFIPFAPGTFASLVAALCYLCFPSMSHFGIFVPLVAGTAVFGVWSGTVMEKKYGRDPSTVVIDEVAGQWTALVALPSHPVQILLAFLFFRVFDILKPGPIDDLQRLPGGWGIMADDLLAGVAANLSVRLVMFFISLLPYSLPL